MKANVGNVDKVIRFLLGIFLVSMFFWVAGTLKWVGLIVGIVFILTALFGRCLLYYPFGINTCKK